jgi:hypothetical protein
MKSVRNSLAALVVIGVTAGSLSAQLLSHGLATPDSFGFPPTYTDQTGRTLELGLDGTDPLLLAIAEVPFLADPTGPLDVAAGNFYGESFYFAGGANMAVPGGTALLVLAVEAVWDNATEAIVEGDQLVFSRIRVRVDVPDDPSSAGTYTVTHPYGVETFEVTAAEVAAAAGGRVINWTNDCLHLDIANPSCSVPAGNQFGNILDPSIASISNYLQWDTGAPAGYLGDPNIGHVVTGSPTGNNLFRVEGPGMTGGASDETNLFSISGKLATPPRFQSLANGLGGTTGIPDFQGAGALTLGTPYTLDLVKAAPNALATLFVGFNSTAFVPFNGGVLVPDPTGPGFRLNGATDGNGQIALAGNFPGAPSGTRLYLQWFINDAVGPAGSSGSNAIQILVP